MISRFMQLVILKKLLSKHFDIESHIPQDEVPSKRTPSRLKKNV